MRCQGCTGRRGSKATATRRVREMLQPLALDHDPTQARGVTLHLRRRPSASQLEAIRLVVEAFHRSPSSGSTELPDGIGFLEARIESATPERGGSMIKWIVPDDRGVAQLIGKASQLPAEGPTLVMLDVSSTLVDWSPSLDGFLAAGKTPWVSAVCMFTSGFTASARGEAWFISARFVENHGATAPLPECVRPTVERFTPSGFDGP
jgi:hypothetical protein